MTTFTKPFPIDKMTFICLECRLRFARIIDVVEHEMNEKHHKFDIPELNRHLCIG